MISVILPVYNSSEFVIRCLDSINNQNFSNFEVVIIDDCSIDDSFKIISNYNFRNGITKIISNNFEHKGASFTRHKAICLSTFEIIAFIDSDDEWFKNKLDLMYNFILKNPSAGIFCSSGICVNNKKEFIMDNYYLWVTSKKWGNDFYALFAKNFLSTSGVMILKKDYFNVGGFNFNLFSAQDYDLWLRLSEIKDIKILKLKLYIYHIRKNSIGSNIKLRFQSRIQIFQVYRNKTYKLGFKGLKLRLFHKSHIFHCYAIDNLNQNKYLLAFVYSVLGFLNFPFRNDYLQRIRKYIVLKH